MQIGVIFLLLFGLATSAPHEGLPLLNPGGIGGIFEGPHSETIIIGPDGSEITSEQKGGAIIQDDSLDARPIIVAEPQPQIVVSPETVVSSTVAPVQQEVSHNYIEPRDIPVVEIVQQDPHVIETEIIAAPDVETDQGADLIGSSGRIITRGSASIVSGPASTTITEPRKIIIAPPKIVEDLPVVSCTTAAPIDPGYSTVGANIISSTAAYDSNLINLGAVGEQEVAAPLIQYSSSNGVISGQVSSTLSPIASNVAVPAEYLLAPEVPQATQSVSSNVQRISQAGNLAVDGRIAMGSTPEPYKLPQVLGDALSQLYTKSVNNLNIDDKMGDLSQNEILPYETPDLSQSRYIGPALSRNGVDVSQVSLAEVPWSQVIRLDDGYYGGRYGRSANGEK